MNERFLSGESISALKALLGKAVFNLSTPNLDAAGAHLAAWTISMLLDKDSFVNFSCVWSETPKYLNDSWQITIAHNQCPINIDRNEDGALIRPCTISMYKATPIETIEVFAFTNAENDLETEEIVNYDQALVFKCARGRSFCIGCIINGPGIATYLHFSEDSEVINAIVEGSSLRLSLS